MVIDIFGLPVDCMVFDLNIDLADLGIEMEPGGTCSDHAQGDDVPENVLLKMVY